VAARWGGQTRFAFVGAVREPPVSGRDSHRRRRNPAKDNHGGLSLRRCGRRRNAANGAQICAPYAESESRPVGDAYMRPASFGGDCGSFPNDPYGMVVYG